MSKTKSSSYFLPTTFSVVIHSVLLGVMAVSWVGGFTADKQLANKTTKDKPEPKIVQAKAVTDDAVQKEIKRLERLDQQKQQRERRLQQQAEKARKQRLAEERRLANLKKQQAKARAEAKRKQAAEKRKAEDALKKLASSLKEKEKKLKEVEAKKQQVEQARKEEAAKMAALKKEQEAAKAKKLAEEKARKQALEQQKQQRLAEQKRSREISAQVEKFGLLVQQKVTRNWLVQGTETDGALCVLKVRLGAGGVVIDVELLHSSGDSALDRSAIAAVYKSSPLPVPENQEAFDKMRELRLTLKPQDILSAS